MLHRTSNNLVFFVLGGRGGGFKIISKTSESALEIYRNGLVDVEGGGVQEHSCTAAANRRSLLASQSVLFSCIVYFLVSVCWI